MKFENMEQYSKHVRKNKIFEMTIYYQKTGLHCYTQIRKVVILFFKLLKNFNTENLNAENIKLSAINLHKFQKR